MNYYHEIAKPGIKGHLFALLAGGLVTLSLAPFDLWLFGILSVLGLLISSQPLNSANDAAIRGWFYGLGLYLAGASWVYVSIHDYGNASVFLALLLTVLFCAFLALLFALQNYCYRRFFTPSLLTMLLVFPAIWVLFEWTKSWLLTGFPWLYLGYGHLNSPLSGWAPVFGVLGISYWLTLSACAIYCLVIKHFTKIHKPKNIYLLLLLLFPWICGYGLTQYNWVTDSNRKTVGIVQGNIPQNIKLQANYLQLSLERYWSMSETLWKNDIIIWPETAVPTLFQNANNYLEQVDNKAKASNTSLITGIFYLRHINKERLLHNSIVALGNGHGVYHKQKLVPFGEFVPLESLIRGLIDFFDLPMSSLSAGPEKQSLLTAADINIAPYICYEIAYPDFVADNLQDANLLVTISNDTWFGSSLGPKQHLQIAQMRALENNRPLIRATNNGISALINHQGQIIQQIPQFQQTLLSNEIHLVRGQTLFSMWQSLPVISWCFLVLLIGIFSRFLSRKTKQ